MSNKWKNVWNNRDIHLDKLRTHDEFELYKELKRIDGFDVRVDDEDMYYKLLYRGITDLYEKHLADKDSIYEVGCGSGANLVLFKNRGKKIGGLDYSTQLVETAKKVTGEEKAIKEAEAVDIDTDEKFDVLISDSVFAYFPDESYGLEVLKKMYEKADKEIILLEMFDLAQKEECMTYRRSQIPDYDEKYSGLDKTFFSKDKLIRFAKEMNCKVEFSEVVNDYYWNSKYMFNCYMIKNEQRSV